jgi:NADPH:quinone reductase-like Zn-dependent oxidoreductase
MKAAISKTYGSPEVIEIASVPKPTYNDNEILVRVYASSVNRTDSGFLRAKPAIVRLFSGITKPKRVVLGCEFAGNIEAVGNNVTKFKIGDKVFGFNDTKFGGHGEYAVYAEKDPLAIMPNETTYKQMAAATEGSHYALSYVRRIQKLGAKRVLVHGATGGIGSAAVQLLKHAGMYVVATSTTKNMKLVKSLGADKVIDWEKSNFTAFPEKFDVVFDSVGKSSFRACKPLLDQKGVYIATELGPKGQNPILGLFSPIYKLFGSRYVLFPIPKNSQKIIEYLANLVADGSFKPVIDREYPLENIKEAYEYVESGQKTGNVIITLG